MKIIIVGCGKFGTRLAKYLNNQGHDLVVIDNREETFNDLDDNFTGKTILGIGYDQEILLQAGIETADTLISCTSSDALNAVVGHIGHNIYHVGNVIVRMYDAKKARIFRSMGINTISVTNLGVERIMDYINPKTMQVVKKIGDDGEIKVIKVKATLSLIDKTVKEIISNGEFEIMAIERYGTTLIPLKDTKIKEDDLIYFTVLDECIDKFKQIVL